MLTKKIHIAKAFSKAASTYNQHANLQQTVGENLLQQIILENNKINKILDLGTGTGYITQKLNRQFPTVEITAIDFAEGMLQYAKQQNLLLKNILPILWCCADADALPFDYNSFDLIFSNLMLQWSPCLKTTFTQIFSLLKPNSVFLFSTFGPNTLYELKKSWEKVDHATHVNKFYDINYIKNSLINANFYVKQIFSETIIINYPSVQQLLYNLKALGANMVYRKEHSILSKTALQKMMVEYNTNFKIMENIPASFEVIYAIAYKPI